jgi:hypothetical protein
MATDDPARQAIHELGTAIAWLAQASANEIGTDLAGQIIAKVVRADELCDGAGDDGR